MTIEAHNSITHDFTAATELLVVGPNVKDLDILLTGLARPMDILRLTHDMNPLRQIADALKGREETVALHLLAHGEPGAIHLGGEPLDFAALYKNEDAVNEIREALAGKAEVALWACSVGWMDAGERFIDALVDKFGATVFASDRPVGAESLGGDWQIGTASPFMRSTEAAYGHTLGTFDFSATPDRNSTYEQTVDGVTMTVELFGGSTTNTGSFFSGFDGPHFYYQGSSLNSITVSFSSAIDITSWKYGQYGFSGNVTFSVTGGSGSDILLGASGTLSPTDWKSVTEVTISGSLDSYFDTIVFSAPVPNAAPEFDDADDTITLVVDEDAGATTIAGLEVTDSNTGNTLAWGEGSTKATKGTVAISGTTSATGNAGDLPTSYTYTPTANTSGNDTFTVDVSDGMGGSDTVTVNVTINEVNDEPTLSLTGSNPSFLAGGSAQTVFSGANISGVESGQGFYGFTLQVTNVTDGANELLNVDGSAITLDGNFSNSTATNSFSVSSSKSGTTVTLAFNNTTISEGTMNTILNGITYQNNQATPTEATRVVSVTQIVDNGGTSNSGDDTADFTTLTSNVVVTIPNAAPEFDDADDALAFTVAEDAGATTFTGLEVTDTNAGNTLTWSVGSAASKGTVTLPSPATKAATGGAGDLPTGNFTYTPTANAEGTDNFTIQVADGNGGTDTVAVTVTITPSNDASVIGGDVSGTVVEGNVGDAAVTTTGTLTITDVDVADTPSFADIASTAGDNGFGSFALASNTWTYTLDQSKVQDLAASATATDTITYTATDSTTQVVTVTINGSNDAATVAGTLTGNVGEDATGTITGTATSTDVDGTDNSFTAATNTVGTHGSLTIGTDGVWTYDLNEASTTVQAVKTGATLTDTIAISAADGTASNVVVTINGANDAPTITLPSTPTVSLGSTNSAIDDALQIVDVDGDNVTVTLTADWSDTVSVATAGLTFTNGDGTDDNVMTFSGTLTDVNTALDSATFSQTSAGVTTTGFRVAVTDGNSGSASSKFNITAVDGDKPTAATVSYNGTEDTPVTLDTVGMAVTREFDAVDTNNYITITGVTGGTLALGAGAATKAADGTTDTAAVGSITSGAFINPADIGKLTFTPTANSTTASTITYTVTDYGTNGPDTSSSATLTINLTAVQDAPTATDNTITLNEDTSYTFKVADFNFADVDSGAALASVRVDTRTLATGDTLQLSGADVTDAQVIAAADIPNLVYKPVANGNGAARSSFTFTVNDGTDNAATTSTLTLNVTDVAESVVTVTPTPEPEPEPVVIRAEQDAENGDDTLTGASLNDTIEAGGGDDTVFGGDGKDSLDGGTGKDTLDGGNDDDFIRGGDGDDSIEGATGDDTLFGGNDSDTIQAGDGNDEVWAGALDDAVDMVNGGAGNDRVGAGGGNDTLDGGAGDDIIFGSTGEDDIVGGGGIDTLFGGAGDDIVNGGAGDDIIWGGVGDDSLTGGEGADTFSFVSGFGSDTIKDFQVSGNNTDKLDLSLIGGLSLADLQASATFEGGNAQLSLGLHGTLILAGIDQTELQAMFDTGQVFVG